MTTLYKTLILLIYTIIMITVATTLFTNYNELTFWMLSFVTIMFITWLLVVIIYICDMFSN